MLAATELAAMTVNSEPVDSVMEQVEGQVEEGGGLQVMQGVQVGGALHPLVEGQVVIMPNGEQQVVISSGQSGPSHLANGNQVVQVQSGTTAGNVHYLLEGGGHLKSEPEDLSFSVQREQGGLLRHSIDLEVFGAKSCSLFLSFLNLSIPSLLVLGNSVTHVKIQIGTFICILMNMITTVLPLLSGMNRPFPGWGAGHPSKCSHRSAERPAELEGVGQVPSQPDLALSPDEWSWRDRDGDPTASAEYLERPGAPGAST